MRTYGNVYFRANGILNGELNTQVIIFIYLLKKCTDYHWSP